MTEKIEIEVGPQVLSNEIKVRPGLTIVRCETLQKFFVRETMERLEDLPPSIIKEVDDFLLYKKQQTG
jgi:hypothetical protein